MNGKVMELNLEAGMPPADAAVRKMINALTTFKGQGVKAVVIVHGYGSTGVGGGIRTAVRKALAENSLRGIVRAQAGGEAWPARKKELLALCGSLKDWDRRIAGNEGVTVVILR